MAKGKKAVVVTTAHRGVFFGYLDKGQDETAKVLTLSQCRNCVYWASNVKGFLGLAVTGPLSGSRVGPAVESLILQEVTSLAVASAEAIKNWEAAPW